MVNARRKLAICSTLNCNPSFAIGGNSIEFVDEWLHLGHMINKHFTDDMDITLCKNRLIGIMLIGFYMYVTLGNWTQLLRIDYLRHIALVFLRL